MCRITSQHERTGYWKMPRINADGHRFVAWIALPCSSLGNRVRLLESQPVMKAAFPFRAASPASAALIVLTLGIPLQASLPAAAQQGQAQPSTKAATVDELNTYMTMGAFNMCSLAQAKVPFKPALDSTLGMIGSVLTQKHGSKVAGAPAPLSREQLLNATVVETVLRVNQFCGKNLPPDWKKEFDPLLAQVQKALAATKGKPAK